MSRQQRRAAERSIAKSITSKPNPEPETIPGEHGAPVVMQYADLNERQRRGYAMWMRAKIHDGMMFFGPSEESAIWISASDSIGYQVSRALRNLRGTMALVYRCQCPDFKKHGVIDCKHIFAERLRREEVIVIGAPIKEPRQKSAQRRPARKRVGHDGRPYTSVKRSANVKKPKRIPELLVSLKLAYDQNSNGIIIPMRKQLYRGGRIGSISSTRAMALVAKIAHGKSADEMISVYEDMIEKDLLFLNKSPCQNTLSDWINDERMTPILHEILRMTSWPVREREIGAMVDSTKVSQLITAHYKECAYNNKDIRENADWMKAHALVGVESLIVMAVELLGSRHDDSQESLSLGLNLLTTLFLNA